MVSVVMTSYNRAKLLLRTLSSIAGQGADVEVIVVEDGYDGGETKAVCDSFGAKYLQRKNRPGAVWSNPAIPTNMGLRAATGDIVILQNAEVMHTGNLIADLSARVDDYNAVFSSVMALKEDGTNDRWYIHSEHRKAPFFFCGAMKRKWFTELRGLDEDYTLAAYDDDDFAGRLASSGVRFVYADDILALHQWHGETLSLVKTNKDLLDKKLEKQRNGEIGAVRNLYHEWGVDR